MSKVHNGSQGSSIPSGDRFDGEADSGERAEGEVGAYEEFDL